MAHFLFYYMFVGVAGDATSLVAYTIRNCPQFHARLSCTYRILFYSCCCTTERKTQLDWWVLEHKNRPHYCIIYLYIYKELVGAE